jgi:hypothetical protein
MATNFSVWVSYLLAAASLGCGVDRSGLGGLGGHRDASFVQEVGRDARPDQSLPRTDLTSHDYVSDTIDVGEDFGEDATSPDVLAADLGLAELGAPDLGHDLAGEDARGLVPDLGPEARREVGRESVPEAAPDVVPPAREVGPEAPKCPAECHEGCNVGCGPKGQCVACPTCACSVESGICHC